MYKKKSEGFTLIELLAVIVLLALIALITYPSVIGTVKKTGNKLSKEQINNIEDAARDYAIKHGPEECGCISVDDLQTGGYLDTGKISNPDNGEQLNGYVTIEWVESQSQYSYKYGESCNCSGTSSGGQIQLVLSVDPGVIKESGWATSTFDVNVRGKNITGYLYCISSTGECTPNTKVIGTRGTISITKDGTNYVCAQGTNSVNDGSVVCKTYKLDASGPVFASESVYFDNYGKTEDYVIAENGTVRCDKTLSELTSDTNKVNCTITNASGRTANKELTFIPNTLETSTAVTSSATTFLGGTLKRSQVKGIYIVDHKNIPSGATSWDVSNHKNGSIIAWYGAPDSNGLYDVYIGQNGGVVATSGNFLFSCFDKLTTLDVSKLDTSRVTNMYAMFYNTNATTLDVSKFNTSKVTNMAFMFSGNHATTINVSGFNTSNVTNMSAMFHDTRATIDVSKFDTSKVTDMSRMFFKSLATTINVSNFNTSNVTNMYGMFYNTKATTLDVSKFDTSKVTDMSFMFSESQATTLDVSKFNTSKVTNMSAMFHNTKATTLDVSKFDTSKVTNMAHMFNGSKVTTLDLSNFNTSKVTDMTAMFSASKVLILDLSSFDTNNVSSMEYIFNGAETTTGYAREQVDADKFNNSSYKPSTLTFTVK